MKSTRRRFIQLLPLAVVSTVLPEEKQTEFDPARDSLELGPNGLKIHKDAPSLPVVSVHDLTLKREAFVWITRNVIF